MRPSVVLLVAVAVAVSLAGCAADDEAPEPRREAPQPEVVEGRPAGAAGNGSQVVDSQEVWRGSVQAGPGVAAHGEASFETTPGNWTHLLFEPQRGRTYAGMVRVTATAPSGGETVVLYGTGAATQQAFIGINSFASAQAVPFEPGTWRLAVDVDGVADLPFAVVAAIVDEGR